MQRKPGYPVANCNIKMPDSVPLSEAVPCDDEGDQQHRRLQLVNFGHAQWGFNNWSWSVNKQDLDFVDFSNGKYCAGVVAFVSVAVKTLDIRRENIGYATCVANMKGSAIHQARKCAVTNALRETLLSFGGSVAAELLESLDARPEPAPQPCAEPPPEPPAKPEPKHPVVKNARKEPADCAPVNMRPPLPLHGAPPAVAPPVARALPMPAPRPPRPPNEEEERAERRRRQRQAQEVFRLRQLAKRAGEGSGEGRGPNHPEEQESRSSVDSLLLAIPSQELAEGKRKSPPPPAAAKRRATDGRDS